MIYLCHATARPSSVKYRVRKRPVSGPVTVPWLYLGRDSLRMSRWQRSLGPGFERVDSGTRLQELSAQWGDAYVLWINEISRDCRGLAWWCSRIAERNTLLLSLFHCICYLQIAVEAAQNQRVLLIVCEDVGLARALRAHPALKQRLYTVGRVALVSARVRQFLSLVARWVHVGIDALSYLIASYATGRPRPQLPHPSPDRPRVLVRTCVDDTYFDADGVGKDRYFPRLAAELRRRGYEVIVVPWLYKLRRSRYRALSWFRQAKTPHLVPEDQLGLVDYLWSFGVIARQARLLRNDRYTFQDLDVTRLVREAGFAELREPNRSRFVRDYRLVEHWHRQQLKFDVFIDTFENMISEKGFGLALKKWMPWVLTVGFQYYSAIPPSWLFLHCCPEEAATAPCPNVIVCNSPLVVSQLAALGFPEAKLRAGASLRQQHLADAARARVPQPNTVLVILYIEPATSAELLERVVSAFPADEGIRFWIKPHPMMSAQGLAAVLKRTSPPAHMTLVQGELGEWLAKASCVVVMGSTAAFEAALTAAPVVVMGSETDFDSNPMAWFPECEAPARGSPDLRAKVLRNLRQAPADQARLRAWAERTRRDAFVAIDDASVLAFVESPLAESPCGPVAARS